MIRRPPRSTPLYSSAASDVYKRQIPIIYIALLVVFIIFALFWVFKCSSGKVRKDRLIELIGFSDDMKYADIYFAWNTCCDSSKTFEIICYREIDQNQLMLLVTAAIRGHYSIYGLLP
eukprot:TRINITY_DN10646_c0_g4_i2.p1 TRINITY_DN10646_c0_g4~~TRINITY_DN10646_c0_g4_i2.p1  ORF type:complete len:126 (+),score=28.32 TRINITY_DN10646_c0_g4_i2:25-378(+)